MLPLLVADSFQLINRNGPGAFLEKGVIVHFGRSEESGTAPAGDTSLKVTMKYRETAFSADRYDELIDQTKVFLTMEEASSGRGKRTRRGAVEQAPCPVVVKKVINPGALSFKPIPNIIEAPRLTTKRMKKSESPPQKEPAVSPSPPAKAMVNVPATSPLKPDKAASESIKEKKEASSGSAEEKMSNRSIHDVGVHELAALLYPSSDPVPVSEKRTVDRHIKRGLLHAVYHFAKPPTLGREDTAVGLLKLHITVAQLSELLTVCPTDRSEMSNRELMPLCACLLDVPAKAAEGRNEFSSVGDGLLHVIRTYLGERKLNAEAVLEFKRGLRLRKQKNCTENEYNPLSSDHASSETLSRLPHGLSIPLSYDHFTIALDLAFEKLKGRQAFENRKGVKGLEYVTNSNGMYAMTGCIILTMLPFFFSIASQYVCLHSGTSGDHNSTSSSSSSSSSSSRNRDDIYNGTATKTESPKTKKGRSKPEKINAMYGAMNPLFIEEGVVQSSRIGCSSDFLDIGSGIGQVVIQVACTVGCVSTG
jgi:Histone methylation protein DOT1